MMANKLSPTMMMMVFVIVIPVLSTGKTVVRVDSFAADGPNAARLQLHPTDGPRQCPARSASPQLPYRARLAIHFHCALPQSDGSHSARTKSRPCHDRESHRSRGLPFRS